MPKLEINQIIFEGEGRAEIFSFRPENVEKERRGNLFFAGNLAKNFPQSDSSYYILNSLAAILKKEYYSSSAPQSSQAFEGALKKVNVFLSKADPKMKDILELIVIALWDSHVMFSSFGRTEVLLIRDGRIFRLTKTAAKNTQVFHHLTKGNVKTNDKIMIGTGQLSHWLGVPSFTSRLLKHSWSRIQNHLYQERIEASDKKTLAMLQIGIYAASSHPMFAEEKELSGEEVESLSPFIKPAFQLRLPIMQEGYGRNSLLTSLKAMGSHLWHFLPAFTSRMSRWNILPQRIVRQVKFPQRTLIVKSALGLGLVVVIFLGMRYVSKPVEDTIFQNELSVVETQGAILMFTQLPSPLEPQRALFTGQGLFVIAQNTLYQLHPETKAAIPLFAIEDEVKGLVNLGDSLAIITKPTPTRWEVLSYNLTKQSTKKEPLSWPLEGDIVEEVKEYVGNVYVLELLEKEIIRYDAGSFQNPVKWISRGAKEIIQNPLSFAVDGSIYFLDTAKTLLELRSGAIVRSIPLPPGVQASMVATSADMRNLYLVDKEAGRMVILEKESADVLSSFQDDRFKGLLALTIDETLRRINLINPHGIFQFTLPFNAR